MRILAGALSAPLLIGALVAQNPALTPTADLTLDTDPVQGRFAYSRIAIPAGVRVTFIGSYAVQLRCDGDADIDGILDVSARGPAINGPGAVSTGLGYGGQTVNNYPNSFWCGQSSASGGGRHAGVYGAALPFDLAGGSPGGSHMFWDEPFLGTCVLTSFANGGGGGGTLVLEANGSLTVRGQVLANGALGEFGAGPGSGGSILLRGIGGLTIAASGNVEARAPQSNNPINQGIIRLDAYAAVPTVLGTVSPAPFSLEQPALRETISATLGGAWQLEIAAPRGDGVFLAASFQPGSYTGPFGTVGIDVFNAISFAVVTTSQSHDPLGYFQLAIPFVPSLLGLELWTAGLNFYTVHPPRYTNTTYSIVR
ncbi:MAG: hypothetical protein NXI31_23445 [bacterium]|nr:hypothetical protein [bacterium]